jgi:hypothetical protein
VWYGSESRSICLEQTARFSSSTRPAFGTRPKANLWIFALQGSWDYILRWDL